MVAMGSSDFFQVRKFLLPLNLVLIVCWCDRAVHGVALLAGRACYYVFRILVIGDIDIAHCV